MRHKRENPRPFWQKALFGFIEVLQLFGIAGGAAASKPAARITPLSQRIRMRETASASSGVRRTSPFVRIEERVIPPAPGPGIAQEKESGSVRYVVRRGDSLWKIAEQEYGQGGRWTDIWKANRENIHEPNLIYSGQNLSVPVEEAGRRVLIHKVAEQRARATVTSVSPAFVSLRRQVAGQSVTLATSIDNISVAIHQVSFGGGSAARNAAGEDLNILAAKAHTLSAATSSAPSNIVLIDSVVGLLDAAHGPLLGSRRRAVLN
ncbi:MAG: Peptidoglycan-binding LysM [Candidatus Adlerbacteria bacterium GW2011_GWC1_50_9]|uniref:Peptidoglycan-binding LysM n=1 Tax=Candidatus Adlerbacteria bacterium GW2011_GWC1_50_9 TaxID=1618608 RepID=A0A0G1WMY8_9BACT|nr:MAG: Peptidoglycan-binding LysM [Candidatus Adlerbacteria bacterium GW2011_GWC1_50_9]